MTAPAPQCEHKEIEACVSWLTANTKKRGRVNKTRTTYSLKHLAEDALGFYVSNESVIAACRKIGRRLDGQRGKNPCADAWLESDLETGEVYFARAVDGGPIKIGWSGDVQKRLATLNTSSPERIEIIGSFIGNASAERDLHDRFSGSRLNGEWFEATPELLALAGWVR